MQIWKSLLIAGAAVWLLSPALRAAEPPAKADTTSAAEQKLKAEDAKKAKAEAKAEAKREAKERKAAKKAAKAEAKKKKAEEKAEAKANAAEPKGEVKKEEAKPAETTPAAAAAKKASKAPELLSAPESPISADKQQRLAELLKKYKADEIGPEQYHAERAKILAEP